jgi:hypothetical protein
MDLTQDITKKDIVCVDSILLVLTILSVIEEADDDAFTFGTNDLYYGLYP